MFLLKILPALIGFLFCLILFLIYIINNDIFHEVIYTYFILPPKIIMELPAVKDFSVFLTNGFVFLKKSLPLILLAVSGIFLHSEKQRSLVFQLILWLVLAAIVIGIQRTSYWPYQFQLLIFPLGILCLIGIDKLLTKYSNSRMILAFVLIIIFIPFAKIILKKTYSFYKYNPINIETRLGYKNLYQYNYLQIKNDVKFLVTENKISGIYICGDPLYYYLANKTQAVSLNGWCLELYLDGQYIELIKELKNKAPEFIYISSEYYDLLGTSAKILQTFFNNNYTMYKQNVNGYWMRKNIENF